MAWLNFLKNGNELSELLIEGNNPYGARLLADSDVTQIKPHIQAHEQVMADVLGRVALAGRGLWVLTDQHLLVSTHDHDPQVQRFKLSELSNVACVKGKYGFTLRATVAHQQLSVYGTSAHMAAMFYRAIGQKIECSPMVKPPVLDDDDMSQATHNFKDAAMRLQAAGSAHAQREDAHLALG